MIDPFKSIKTLEPTHQKMTSGALTELSVDAATPNGMINREYQNLFISDPIRVVHAGPATFPVLATGITWR